ncbi:MAG: glycosyltransferase [Pseudomonadota bacterium]
MKVLIVTYAYWPDRAPRAYRWTAIAEHWAGRGHEIHVVSGWKSGDRPAERRHGVHIHRAGGALEAVRGLIGRRPHGEALASPPGSARALIGRAAKAIYDATLKQVLWPDYACLWYRPALRAARRLAQAIDFEALVSVSHPFTGHLVGLGVKRKFPALRWLADVGDPFSLPDDIALNNRVLYGRLNRRTEAGILARADAVAVTVEGCRRAYEAAFAACVGRIMVIGPLLSLPQASARLRLGAAGRHLVYVGTLYRRVRRPDFLLALFDALARRHDGLHLHFFGSLNDAAESFRPYRPLVGRRLHLHGLVSREEVAQAMREADVLVNIGNATPHQLPSKLVEYASLGKPILNLASGPGDTAAEFLARYPAAMTLTASGAPTAAAVARALDFVLDPPPVDPATAADFVAGFRIETIAADYQGLIASGPALARAKRAATV